MLLTPEQLHEIAEIIRLHHQAFIANVISPDAVTADTLQKLKDAGMLNVQVQSMEQAYLYGQALQLAQEPVLASMGYDAFREYVKKNPIPLTAVEKQAVAMAQMTAGQYCRGLGNVVDKETGAVLIEADQELRWRMETEIKNKVAENIAKRETIKQLKSKLGWATGDWTRNWDRIAITEKHNAMERGRADVIRKEVGKDARVFRRAMPDCCTDCDRLYTDKATNTPLIFKLSTLEANGTNVGRKRAQWKPVIGATHPHCQCITTELPPGWGFNDEGDMVPGGEHAVEYSPPKPSKGEKMQKAFPTVRTLDVQGMRINIEHPAGSVRPWRRADGSEGSTVMLAHYGYVRGTTGADSDEIDVYVGPEPQAPYAYVVHQLDPETGQYDEAKCMLGFQSEHEAVAMWRRHYDRPERYYGWCEPVAIDSLRRQVESTADEQGGAPRLVVPLQKAGLTADMAGADSVYGNRAVGSGGGGPNVQFKIPWRTSKQQVTDEDLNTWAGMRVEGIKRDPDIYVFQNPANQVRKLELPDNYAGQILEPGEVEAQRAEIMNRFMLRRPLRNASDLRKGDPPILKIGAKGGKIVGHTKTGKAIYLSKESGAAGGLHALGLVAEHMHGKIVPNSQDKTGRTLKVPQSDINEKTLTALSTALGLEAPVIKGGKYYVMPLSGAQLAKIKNLKIGDPEKKTDAPKPAPAPTATVWEGPAQREAGWEPYADNVELIDVPTPPARFITRGQPVVATVAGEEINTELRGTNKDGDPTVTVNGKRHAMLWSGVKRAEPAVNKAALHKLSPEKVVKAGERQQRLVNTVMQMEVCHAVREGELVPLSAGAVADHYRANNEEIYLVGGIVRDLLAGTTKTSTVSDAELEKQMNDVDYVTSANPARMHRLLEQMGVENHGRALRWGCAITKQPDMPGLDMACFASGTGTNHPAVEVVTPRGEEIWEPPGDFDHDMEADSERRDFTCNALMYDVHNHAIIDPTGQGIGDAQARVLRLANFSQDNLDTNQLLCVRFWKFRSRGFTAEAQTLKAIKQQAQTVMAKWATDTKSGAGTMAWHIAGKGPDPEKELAKFRAAMEADGMADLYDKYIKPMHKKIFKAVEKNKKEAKLAMLEMKAQLEAQKAASKAKAKKGGK